ncbi:MAG: carbohydrate deacetylase [Myxococcaceae bacterium]
MKRLIVNADDLGYDPAVTRGIVECLRFGLVRSTTLMVNTPFSQDAASAAHGFAVGLHFNLARWRALSPSFPKQFLEQGELAEAVAGRLPGEVVEEEVLAQAEYCRSLLGKAPTHIDVHKHLHRHAGVFAGLTSAAQRLGLPVRALDDDMRAALAGKGIRRTNAFIGDAGAEPYWTLEQWRAALAGLQAGVTELMCHPGYAPTHVRSGYSAQREGELATFTAKAAKDALLASGVDLVTFDVV